MGQYIGPAIMFGFTVFFTVVLLLPIRFYKMPSPVVNFYWRMFWIYLALISVAAGISNVLMLLGFDVMRVSMAIYTGLMASYVAFVVFAWFRLVGIAAYRAYITVSK